MNQLENRVLKELQKRPKAKKENGKNWCEGKKKRGNGIEMETTDSIVWIKRNLQANEENEEEGMQKMARGGEFVSLNITVLTTRQHSREP